MDRADNNRDLNAVSNRLAAQTEHLQGHLQQQLNLNGAGQARNMFASRPAGLASLGEDAEATSDSAQTPSTFHRQGGPRFAGNAAFQSALARHSNQTGNSINSSSAADFRANLSHQRQLSLQSRFADLGYNVGSGLGAAPSEADDMTDDGSVGYGASAFDPTRGQRSHASDFSFGSSGTAGSHRRTGSDMSGMLSNRGGHQPAASVGGNSNSLSAQSQMLAEQQIALQQQIEMLQLQQQQLMHSAGLGQQGSVGNSLNGSSHSFGGHRRIQSHAPRSGPMGSFSTAGAFNGGALANFAPSQPATPTPSLPRGHGRRHSVNVLNKANQQQQQQQQQQ